MAKNIGCLIIVLLLSFSSSAGKFQRVNESFNCLRETFNAEIGIREQGWNAGQRVEEYLKSVKLSKGNPWCAAFVVWCHIQCDIYIVLSGYSPSLFPKKNIVTNPRPGDVFGIYFANKGRIAHVGFIDEVRVNSYITVEGNTGSDNYGQGTREGDGVYKKVRLKKQIYKVSRW
jgi:hypothetical protein